MMTSEQKEVLNKYAEIKQNIKELEILADELNPKVLEIMDQSECEEIAIGDMGKLSLGARRTWKYPEAITDKETELKAEKKEAEQLGTAKYTEKKYVIFKKLGERDE